MILICSTPTTPTVGFMACVRACLEMCVCACVRFALVCCALRVDFINSLRLTNTVIIIIIIIKLSTSSVMFVQKLERSWNEA